MTVLIVFALVAVFQGCHGGALDDLNTIIEESLEGYEHVMPSVEHTIRTMVNESIDVVDALVAGATKPCIAGIKADLNGVTAKVMAVANACETPAIAQQAAIIRGYMEAVDGTVQGLLGQLVTVAGNVVNCLLSLGQLANSARALPADLFRSIEGILASFNNLDIATTKCTHDALIEAIKEIAKIMKGVNTCLASA